jgi:hypothetical protein
MLIYPQNEHAGQKFMNGRTLETETEGFYRAFNNVMNGQQPTAEDISRSYRKSSFEARLPDQILQIH